MNAAPAACAAAGGRRAPASPAARGRRGAYAWTKPSEVAEAPARCGCRRRGPRTAGEDSPSLPQLAREAGEHVAGRGAGRAGGGPRRVRVRRRPSSSPRPSRRSRRARCSGRPFEVCAPAPGSRPSKSPALAGKRALGRRRRGRRAAPSKRAACARRAVAVRMTRRARSRLPGSPSSGCRSGRRRAPRSTRTCRPAPRANTSPRTSNARLLRVDLREPLRRGDLDLRRHARPRPRAIDGRGSCSRGRSRRTGRARRAPGSGACRPAARRSGASGGAARNGIGARLQRDRRARGSSESPLGARREVDVVGLRRCRRRVPEAISWRTSFGRDRARVAVRRARSRGAGRPVAALAARSAPRCRRAPPCPSARPVASEEHDDARDRDRDLRVEVRAAVERQVGARVAGVKVSSNFVTELTRITCGRLEGQLLCWAASSAAEAITVTPWS